MMRLTGRSVRSFVAVAGLTALVTATVTVPAQAMPERYRDAGTIVWCEGEGGYLEAYDTTMGGEYWAASIVTGDSEAVASGESVLLVGDRLSGRHLAHDAESGDAVGRLSIDGTISRGATEAVSGWDVDPDGRRYRSEGTRISLSGSVTLRLGPAETTLSCNGWEIDLETFVLNREPAAQRGQGWYTDVYELGGGEAIVGFYGDRRTKLGVGLDLLDPDGNVYASAGEQLQVRNGRIAGTLIMRDSETGQVVGVANVVGTVKKTGSERVVERSKRPNYRYVYDRTFYDVSLSISSTAGHWGGTFEATHEVVRARATIPPRSLR